MFDVVVVMQTASLAMFIRLVGMIDIPADDSGGADASPMCTVVVDVPASVAPAMDSPPKVTSEMLDTLNCLAD